MSSFVITFNYYIQLLHSIITFYYISQLVHYIISFNYYIQLLHSIISFNYYIQLHQLIISINLLYFLIPYLFISNPLCFNYHIFCPNSYTFNYILCSNCNSDYLIGSREFLCCHEVPEAYGKAFLTAWLRDTLA